MRGYMENMNVAATSSTAQEMSGHLKLINANAKVMSQEIDALKRRVAWLTSIIVVILVLAISALGGVVAGSAHAAAPWPKPVVDAANNMECKHRVSAADGEGGAGLSCTATNRKGERQRFLVLRHADTQHGLDWWRWFIDDGGYFARRGHVFLIPMGTKTTPAFTRKWARWAAAYNGDTAKVVAA